MFGAVGEVVGAAIDEDGLDHVVSGPGVNPEVVDFVAAVNRLVIPHVMMRVDDLEFGLECLLCSQRQPVSIHHDVDARGSRVERPR